MTKFKNFLTAVIAAMILVLACIMPAIIAFADDGAEGPTDPPQPPQNSYEDLYYFSDNEKCSQRFVGFVSEFNDAYSASIQGHLIDWSASNGVSSITKVYNYLTPNGFPEIENSLVIFEVCNEACLQYFLGYENGMDETEHDYADTDNLLFTFFSELKGRNCKIMFICGFDEIKFMSHNSFLEFADIHVNTSLFDNFMQNVIYRVQESGRMDNRTVIFDFALSYGMDVNYGDKAINNSNFTTYFLTHFILTYMDELAQASGEAHRVFVDNGIKFLFYLGDGIFYDGVEDAVISEIEDDGYSYLSEYLSNEKVCVIGASWKGEDKLEELYTILDFAYRAGGSSADMEFYIYNIANYSLNFINGYLVRTEGTNLSWFESTLNNIACDFIDGNDLTVYDNWTGRCDVTYKPVTFSPNGWFYDFGWNRSNYPKWLEFFGLEYLLKLLDFTFVWKL